MANIFDDSFTGADSTTLETYDSSWSKIGSTGTLTLYSNRVKSETVSEAPYYVNSASPPSADYSVSADVYFSSGTIGAAQAGVVGRYSTTAVTGYRAMLRHDGTNMLLALYRQSAGTSTQLGSNYPVTFAIGDTINVKLKMEGSTISVYLNGSSTAAISVTDSTHTVAGKSGLHVFFQSSAGREFHVDNFTVDTLTGDVVAPTLTSPTATATGQTTASGTVSTNEANGTIYWTASANSTETAATVKAGSSQTVSATGTQNVSVTGLTAGTAYYLHYVHRDAAGNDSTVSTSAQFTTSAAVVRGVEATLYNGSTAQASLSGIRALWWDATAPTGAPDYESTTETTDAAGLLSIDIDSVTTLSVGQSGFLLLYKLDGTDHRASLVFAGQVAVSDIS